MAKKSLTEPRKRGRKKDNPDTGLFERVAGSGVWWIQWHDGQGKRHREKVGSKAAARQLYAERKTRVLRNEKLPDLVPKPVLTVAAMIERYRPSWEAKKSASDDDRYAGYWTEALGKLPAADVRPSDIEAWRARRLKQDGVRPATCNRACAFLRRVYNLAIRDEVYAGSNPVAKVKQLRENNAVVRYLSEEEEAALKAHSSPEFWRKVEIAFLSGLRQGEQFGLRRSDLDFRAKVITVRESKHGEARRVPMSERLEALFREQLATHTGDWVFPGRDEGAHYFPKSSIHALKSAMKRAGVENFRWHDLRHTFCSRLAMAGASLTTIKDLAGHKTITVTQRYAHLSPEHNRAAIELLAPTGPKPAPEAPLPWDDPEALADALLERLDEASLSVVLARLSKRGRHLRVVR